MKLSRGECRQLALLGLPALVLYLAFVIGPILGAAALSLYRWDGISAPAWLGLANFQRALFGDPIFARSFVNNAVYVVITLVVEVGFGLLFAGLLQARLPLGGLWRALFFSPMVLSLVVVGVLFSFVFNPDAGLLNLLLRQAGLGALARSWLGDDRTALIAVSLVSGWRYAGFYMALFAAGLKRIPPEVLEAGRLDGAGEWRLFQRITLPILAPVTAIALLLCVTGGFQAFDLFFVMTNGGPYHSTEIPSLWMVKKAFNRQSLGYGSSLGVLLTLFVACLGWLQLRLQRRDD
jgi:ABC-type sugar transport system permease subunit